MRHFSFFPSFLLSCVLLMFACTGTRSNKEKSAATAGNTQTETTTMTAADYHYVVTMKFSPQTATPVGAVREAGEAPLLIVPAGEMFLAIYEAGQLTYYADFPNPLRVRGTESEEKAVQDAEGVLLFPAWASDSRRMAAATIGLYAVKAYNPAFAETVKNSASLQTAVSKGMYERTYTLNGQQLADLLKRI